MSTGKSQPAPDAVGASTLSPELRTAITELSLEQVEALRDQLASKLQHNVGRWNANPDDVQRSVIKLVLTLVDFIRQLLERQAIRRMDSGSLTEEQIEAVGRALMQLEQTVHDLARQFDLSVDDLNLHLGPLGKLL